MIVGRLLRRLVFGAAISAVAGLAPAAETNFPFDGELRLDAYPMPGSKRVPFMDIAASGAIVLEMWCNRVEGQVVVAADTITVLTNAPTDRPCQPARAAADADLLAALTEVTNWRRQGDTVTLIGRRTLRFRVPTN
jgi:heat shock protein HslJ